jgi:hypothetical protein
MRSVRHVIISAVMTLNLSGERRGSCSPVPSHGANADALVHHKPQSTTPFNQKLFISSHLNHQLPIVSQCNDATLFSAPLHADPRASSRFLVCPRNRATHQAARPKPICQQTTSSRPVRNRRTAPTMQVAAMSTAKAAATIWSRSKAGRASM